MNFLGHLSKKERNRMKHLRRMNRPKKRYLLVHNEDVFTTLPDRLILEQIRTNQLGQKVFAFKPTPKFLKLSELYEGVRNTHNPDNVSQFIQHNPFYPEVRKTKKFEKNPKN